MHKSGIALRSLLPDSPHIKRQHFNTDIYGRLVVLVHSFRSDKLTMQEFCGVPCDVKGSISLFRAALCLHKHHCSIFMISLTMHLPSMALNSF